MKSILNSTIILLKRPALTNLVLSIIEPRYSNRNNFLLAFSIDTE